MENIDVFRELSEGFNWLFVLLFRGHENHHKDLKIVFEETNEKELLQVASAIDRACMELPRLFKGYPLKGADEQTF